ncbi:GNAT family N-acetyltransferase [Microbacterium sp.]|uniref:GNAT family N-acetyltransferase n=1 Tax=Microbacterium sp. TaxID=51671 RepID=UPI0039E6C528
MAHVDLRPFDDDDLDAVFEMMRDPDAVALASFTADDPDDRAAFDAWIAAERAAPSVALHVVTEDGGFVGTAAAFQADGDREVSFWIARYAWGRGVGSAALRLLITREPERPLYARIAAHNAAAIALVTAAGFTEVSRSLAYAPALGRDVEEVVFTLVPSLDGV